MKGAFKYLQPLLSFFNFNTGLIYSKIFDDFRKVLVPDSAVYGFAFELGAQNTYKH